MQSRHSQTALVMDGKLQQSRRSRLGCKRACHTHPRSHGSNLASNPIQALFLYLVLVQQEPTLLYHADT
jgi:hypothetical protein